MYALKGRLKGPKRSATMAERFYNSKQKHARDYQERLAKEILQRI